jgi:hypothetical protein
MKNQIFKEWCLREVITAFARSGDITTALDLLKTIHFFPTVIETWAKILPYLPSADRDEIISSKIIKGIKEINKNNMIKEICEGNPGLNEIQNAVLMAVLHRRSLRGMIINLVAEFLSHEQKGEIIKWLINLDNDLLVKCVGYEALAPYLSPEENNRIIEQLLKEIMNIEKYLDYALYLNPVLSAESGPLQHRTALQILSFVDKKVNSDRDKKEILSNLSAHLPDELWDNFFTTIENIVNNEVQFNVIKAAADVIPNKLLDKFRELLLKIDDNDQRTIASVSLFPYMEANMFPDILDMIKNTKGEFYRAMAIRIISPHISREKLVHILDLLETITYPTNYIETGLAGVIRYLPDEKKKLYLEKAMEIISGMDDSERASWCIESLAGYFPIEMQENAVDISRKIRQMGSPEYSYISSVRALAGLLPYLKNGLHDVVAGEIYKEMNQMEDDAAKPGLIEVLADDIKNLDFMDIIHLIDTIKTAYYRLMAYISLSPHLTVDQQAYIVEPVTNNLVNIDGDKIYPRRVLENRINSLIPSCFNKIFMTNIKAAENVFTCAIQCITSIDERNEHWKAEAVEKMAEQVPPHLFAELVAITHSIKSFYNKARCFISLSSAASQEEKPLLLENAFLAAIKESWDIGHHERNKKIIQPLIDEIIKTDSDFKQGMWQKAPAILTNLKRPELLNIIFYFSPVFHEIVGKSGIMEIYRTIQDVGKWWD